MSVRRKLFAATAVLGALLSTGSDAPAASTPTTNATPAVAPAELTPTYAPHVRKLHAVDADNHNILLNRAGVITVVVGTNEDSQQAARAAGRAMYPFQGRPDFALIVVVDLRDSMAGWVPTIVTARMRVSLDQEAVELKPWFLKNGSKNNPRSLSHVIPDFKGTICPDLGWKDGSDKLRAVIFGVDGRELVRLDQLEDMSVLQEAVRKALQAQVDAEQARLGAIPKLLPGSRLPQPVRLHPPLIPYTPFAPSNED